MLQKLLNALDLRQYASAEVNGKGLHFVTAAFHDFTNTFVVNAADDATDQLEASQPEGLVGISEFFAEQYLLADGACRNGISIDQLLDGGEQELQMMNGRPSGGQKQVLAEHGLFLDGGKCRKSTDFNNNKLVLNCSNKKRVFLCITKILMEAPHVGLLNIRVMNNHTIERFFQIRNFLWVEISRHH